MIESFSSDISIPASITSIKADSIRSKPSGYRTISLTISAFSSISKSVIRRSKAMSVPMGLGGE